MNKFKKAVSLIAVLAFLITALLPISALAAPAATNGNAPAAGSDVTVESVTANGEVILDVPLGSENSQPASIDTAASKTIYIWAGSKLKVTVGTDVITDASQTPNASSLKWGLGDTLGSIDTSTTTATTGLASGSASGAITVPMYLVATGSDQNAGGATTYFSAAYRIVPVKVGYRLTTTSNVASFEPNNTTGTATTPAGDGASGSRFTLTASLDKYTAYADPANTAEPTAIASVAGNRPAQVEGTYTWSIPSPSPATGNASYISSTTGSMTNITTDGSTTAATAIALIPTASNTYQYQFTPRVTDPTTGNDWIIDDPVDYTVTVTEANTVSIEDPVEASPAVVAVGRPVDLTATINRGNYDDQITWYAYSTPAPDDPVADAIATIPPTALPSASPSATAVTVVATAFPDQAEQWYNAKIEEPAPSGGSAPAPVYGPTPLPKVEAVRLYATDTDGTLEDGSPNAPTYDLIEGVPTTLNAVWGVVGASDDDTPKNPDTEPSPLKWASDAADVTVSGTTTSGSVTAVSKTTGTAANTAVSAISSPNVTVTYDQIAGGTLPPAATFAIQPVVLAAGAVSVPANGLITTSVVNGAVNMTGLTAASAYAPITLPVQWWDGAHADPVNTRGVSIEWKVTVPVGADAITIPDSAVTVASNGTVSIASGVFTPSVQGTYTVTANAKTSSGYVGSPDGVTWSITVPAPALDQAVITPTTATIQAGEVSAPFTAQQVVNVDGTLGALQEQAGTTGTWSVTGANQGLAGLTPGANHTVTLNPSASLAGSTITLTYTYTKEDGTPGSASAIVNIEAAPAETPVLTLPASTATPPSLTEAQETTGTTINGGTVTNLDPDAELTLSLTNGTTNIPNVTATVGQDGAVQIALTGAQVAAIRAAIGTAGSLPFTVAGTDTDGNAITVTAPGTITIASTTETPPEEAPTLTTIPSSSMWYIEGADAVDPIAINATGAGGSYTYVWHKGDAEGPVVGTNASSYTPAASDFADVAVDDTVTYTVVVTGANGASSTATFTYTVRGAKTNDLVFIEDTETAPDVPATNLGMDQSELGAQLQLAVQAVTVAADGTQSVETYTGTGTWSVTGPVPAQNDVTSSFTFDPATSAAVTVTLNTAVTPGTYWFTFTKSTSGRQAATAGDSVTVPVVITGTPVTPLPVGYLAAYAIQDDPNATTASGRLPVAPSASNPPTAPNWTGLYTGNLQITNDGVGVEVNKRFALYVPQSLMGAGNGYLEWQYRRVDGGNPIIIPVGQGWYGVNSNTLISTPVTAAMDGWQFRLVARPEYGAAATTNQYSEWISLKVKDAQRVQEVPDVSISSSPESHAGVVTIAETGTVILTAGVQNGLADASLAYQWQSRPAPTAEAPDPQWANIPDATDRTYTLENVAAALNGTAYRCTVSNNSFNGIAANSEPVTLQVNTAAGAVIVMTPTQPSLVNRFVTRTATFAVTAKTDNGDDVTYSWFRRGAAGPVSIGGVIETWQDAAAYLAERPVSEVAIEGATSPEYTTEPLEEGVYEYVCRVTNATNTTLTQNSPGFYVVVTQRSRLPEITEPDPNAVVTPIGTPAGQAVTFTCKATVQSQEPMTYQWQASRDGVTWNNLTGATSATLTIPAPTGDNDGWYYRCLVRNANELSLSTPSTPYRLTVWNTATLPTVVGTIEPRNIINATWNSTTTLTLVSKASVPVIDAASTTQLSSVWKLVGTSTEITVVPVKDTAASNETRAVYTSTLNVPLTTEQIALANCGNWECIWTNEQETVVGADLKPAVSTGTCAVSYMIPGCPNITVQPVDVTAAVGTTATLRVGATLNPSTFQPAGSLVYVWQRSTDGGITWENCPAGNGQFTAAYSVPLTQVMYDNATAANDRGFRSMYTYRVNVANRTLGLNLYSSNAVLTITPGVETQPAIGIKDDVDLRITTDADGAKILSGSALTVSKDGTAAGTVLTDMVTFTPENDAYQLQIVRPGEVETVLGGDDIVGTGCILRLVDTSNDNKVLDEATIVVRGDVYGSGIISLTQLVRMAAAYKDPTQLTGVYLLAGDLDGNGSISLTDLVQEAAIYRAEILDAGATPTPEPTTEPTAEPTATSTGEPTAQPTAEPTAEPTEEPTAAPTETPAA